MDALLKMRQVEQLVGAKRSWIYQRITEGGFPRPVQLGVRSVAWKASDIENWINNLPERPARGGARP